MNYKFSVSKVLFTSALLFSSHAMANAKFNLINPDTNKVIKSGIVANDQVVLNVDQRFNFDIKFEGLNYDSVKITTTDGYSGVERTAPYAACGDSSGDFKNCSTMSGYKPDFALTARAFKGSSAVGSPATIYILSKVPEPPQASGIFLKLMDSSSGKAVQSNIVNGSNVSLDGLNTFSFKLESDGAAIDRVEYRTSTGHAQTESKAPYSLCGDSGGSYTNCANLAGFKGGFVLTAKAYKGSTQVGETTKVNVYRSGGGSNPDPVEPTNPVPVEPTNPTPSVSFKLIDPISDTVKKTLSPGQTITLNKGSAFTFEANFKDVKFDRIVYTNSNGQSQTESKAPYAACGDKSGDYYNCGILPGYDSNFTLTAQAFNGSTAVGKAKILVNISSDTTSGGGSGSDGTDGSTGGSGGDGTDIIVAAPVVTYTSGNVVVTAGSNATLNIQATGSSLTYKWFKDGVALSNTNSAKLTLQNVSNADQGYYFCKVSNSQGISKSDTIQVKVLEPVSTGSLSISWKAPAKREDGSQLYGHEIKTYKVYYGLTSKSGYSDKVVVAGDRTQVNLLDLSHGEYKVAISTVDSDGFESDLSKSIVINLQ